ncbi:MAG: MFS transporter, partial [Planctomycetales bacterium]|nr:MFS transporter [Planctomycetales bacterium]
MLLIPFFFRKLGLKMMILVGMASWVIRYVLFAYGAPSQVTWMILLAVALHGVCYDFFFVTGFMYTDQKAPQAIRGQAQGLLVFLTQGLGMFFGYRSMGSWHVGELGKQVDSQAYVDSLIAARGDTQVSFFETFGKMFSRALPDGINQELLSSTMAAWKNFWLFPAVMAAVILVVFALTFWDKAKDTSTASH